MKQEVKTLWIGLDVAKPTFDAAAHIAGVAKVPTFARTREGAAQLLEWADGLLARHLPDGQVRIVMEATGSYSLQLLGWLLELRPSCAPAIINPSYIKAFAQSLGARNKTDKSDARIIARYGHERTPAPEEPPCPARARLRELVRERSHVVATITAETNRQAEPCGDRVIVKLRQKRVATLKKQFEELDKLIRQHVKTQPALEHDVKLLETIPGVGFIVAVTVLGEIGDLRRFSRGRKLAAFCGLSPRRHQSGATERPTRMCRTGNANVRPLLHLGARSLIGRKYHLAKFYEHLLRNGKSKRAALAAVSRKILIQMHAVLMSNTPYSDTFNCVSRRTNLWKTCAFEVAVA